MKCKFIIFLIALTSCTHTAKSQNNITLSVDVEKIPEMGFVISYLKESMIGMDFDAKGHAEYRIEDMDAIYLTLHNGFAEQKTIYAEKGDHIQLSFDGESMKKTLKMEGVRENIADYLKNVKISWPANKDFALDIKDFVKLLKEKVKENQQLLDSLTPALTKESSKFVKLEKNRIKYMLGLSLLDYPRMHPYMAKIEYTPGDDYYNELKAWLEEDLNSLCLSQYRTLMTEVPTFIMSRKTPIRTPYEKAMKQMEYINNNTKDEQVKQNLLTIIANNYIKDAGIQKSTELDTFYRKHVTDKELLAQYQQTYDSWAAVSPGQPAPDFKAVDISDKEFSLKDFKGKYVCLYLWPCVSPAIQQFAELKKLQPLFKKKNIVLVNLSIENKKDNWVQTIQNEEVQVGTHLYAGFDKHFLQKCHYSAASMVQFIFIDPAGKIIELQAPLQSSNMEDFIKETIQD